MLVQEEKNEIAKSLGTVLLTVIKDFGFLIPILNINSQIKQQRVIRFIEMLSEYFGKENINKMFNENLTKEYFLDLFEDVIFHVTRNKIERKLLYFRNILINNIEQNIQSDFTESFLDILLKINEKQIIILETYRKAKNDEIVSDDELFHHGVYGGSISKINSSYRKHNYYNLGEAEYSNYVQDLISKALLINLADIYNTTIPFELIEISTFGISFLDFIKHKGKIIDR